MPIAECTSSRHKRARWSATLPGVGEPVLDRHVNVAQLWRLACHAARKGEKWGQGKKSVRDAMESYYTQLGRDKRGAKQWVAAVVDVLDSSTRQLLACWRGRPANARTGRR